ncbi:MAG: DUF3662 domain-containing protein [Chloroflexi bacterium]|nr:DUF3662 domain-containing protein [Chloroflexota bacterium]
MRPMNSQHITRLEEQLERLVEGAFTQFFGKKVHAHDIALELSRAMEDNAIAGHPGDPRPVAPDRFTILLNSDVLNHLLHRQPALADILSQHMIELATNAGYRLNNVPQIEILPDASLGTGTVMVQAQHSDRRRSTTALMQRVEPPAALPAPLNPQLLIHGRPPIPLQQDVINIGRSRDNHVIVDDGTVSRHHLQIRLRLGRFMLFDTQSQGGTFVNGVRVKEHTLQAGDVIRIGNTQMVYMEDHPLSETETGVYPPAPSESS